MVPYYGSLLSVYIGIKKWVINSVIGYILGNGYSLLTRPLLYTLYTVPYYVYPQSSPVLYTLLTRPLLYTLYVVPYYVYPSHETLTIYPPHETLTIYLPVPNCIPSIQSLTVYPQSSP